MEVLLFLITTFAGMVLGAVFDDPIKDSWKRLRRAAVRLLEGSDSIREPHTLRVGDHNVPFVVIDGDGLSEYPNGEPVCRIVPAPSSIPANLQRLRDDVAATIEAGLDHGTEAVWNGPKFALANYRISRTQADESMRLRLDLWQSDYAWFLATVAQLDQGFDETGHSLRDRHLADRPFDSPEPHMAQGMGVSIAVLTADERLVVSTRSPSSGVRPGELDVSVCEGVHPDKDVDEAGQLSLRATARRGLLEEQGTKVTDTQISLLGFGVDTEFYQWGVLGVARLECTAEELLARRSQGAAGKWELKQLECIVAEPAKVFARMKSQRVWAFGWVTVYWALMHRYGARAVRSATDGPGSDD